MKLKLNKWNFLLHSDEHMRQMTTVTFVWIFSVAAGVALVHAAGFLYEL